MELCQQREETRARETRDADGGDRNGNSDREKGGSTDAGKDEDNKDIEWGGEENREVDLSCANVLFLPTDYKNPFSKRKITLVAASKSALSGA